MRKKCRMFGEEKAKFTFKAVRTDLTFFVAEFLSAAEMQQLLFL